jgi:hypothetical protein
MQKLKFLGVLVVLALGLATAMLLTSGVGSAKITPTVTCTNGGSNEPPGQQPSCNGGGLTPESSNVNPSGGAPPGHNK